MTVIDNQDFVGENIKVKKTMVVGSKEHQDYLKRNQKTGLDAVLAAIGPKKQVPLTSPAVLTEPFLTVTNILGYMSS